MSLLRRLHFEAVTMVVAHLKTNVAVDASTEGGRKLPPVEKVARLNDSRHVYGASTSKVNYSRHTRWWTSSQESMTVVPSYGYRLANARREMPKFNIP